MVGIAVSVADCCTEGIIETVEVGAIKTSVVEENPSGIDVIWIILVELSISWLLLGVGSRTDKDEVTIPGVDSTDDGIEEDMTVVVGGCGMTVDDDGCGGVIIIGGISESLRIIRQEGSHISGQEFPVG